MLAAAQESTEEIPPPPAEEEEAAVAEEEDQEEEGEELREEAAEEGEETGPRQGDADAAALVAAAAAAPDPAASADSSSSSSNSKEPRQHHSRHHHHHHHHHHQQQQRKRQRQPRRRHAHRDGGGTEEAGGDEEDHEGDIDPVQMRREMVEMERIIAGFQKENEKLMIELKKRTAGTHALPASRMSVRRDDSDGEAGGNAEAHDQADDGDTLDVRGGGLGAGALMRLGDAGGDDDMTATERELRFEIDKLRKEKKELLAATWYASRGEGIEEDGQRVAERERRAADAVVEEVRRRYEAELAKMRSKIAWYAENQAMIDDNDGKVQKMESEIQRLRNTLAAWHQKRRGTLGGGGAAAGHGSVGTVGAALQEPPEPGQSASARNTAAPSLEAGSGEGRRPARLQHHPADVKRIKQLEKQVRDMEESMQKRYPDSISNLIQATKPTASVQIRADEMQERIQELEKELDDTKQGYERKIRALRQQYEQLRVRYEQRVEELAAREGPRDGPRAPERAESPQAPLSKREQETNESVQRMFSGDGLTAEMRIEELQKRLDSQHAFFTKRIEEKDHKHQTQIRNLRRGRTDIAGLMTQEEHESRVSPLLREIASLKQQLAEANDAQQDRMLLPPGVAPTPAQPPQVQPPQPPPASTTMPAPTVPAPVIGISPQDHEQALELLKQDYENRLALLEQELMLMASALGAAQAVAETSAATSPSPASAPTPPSTAAPAQAPTSASAVAAAPMPAQGPEAPAMERQLVERGQNVEPESASVAAHREAPASAPVPVPPSAPPAQLVERRPPIVIDPAEVRLHRLMCQVENLEGQLEAREQELMRVVKESREISRVETMRLESVHQAEMREKDEELRRFKEELDALVTMMQQMAPA